MRTYLKSTNDSHQAPGVLLVDVDINALPTLEVKGLGGVARHEIFAVKVEPGRRFFDSLQLAETKNRHFYLFF